MHSRRSMLRALLDAGLTHDELDGISLRALRRLYRAMRDATGGE